MVVSSQAFLIDPVHLAETCGAAVWPADMLLAGTQT